MNDCDDFGGPGEPYARRHLEGFTRCYKGGGGSAAAIEEQKAARLQSAAQFKEQMALMRQQYEDAQNIKTPVYAPAAPASAGSQDVYTAGLQARMRQQRRFGSAATVLSRPILGGAVPMAS